MKGVIWQNTDQKQTFTSSLWTDIWRLPDIRAQTVVQAGGVYVQRTKKMLKKHWQAISARIMDP